ncbi:MAG: hydrogenase formation protein HypD [Bilifractor sp.]
MDRFEKAIDIIRNYDGPDVRIMEVCGTHTHEIFRQGIRSILSPHIHMISGPGCPVCVTGTGYIDEAIWLAQQKDCTILTFGDLVRVPGSEKSLQLARAEGARIRTVYSPQDGEVYAKEHPREKCVFLSVGFETTTPGSCIAVRNASRDRLENFSLLTANKTMPAAYDAMKDSTDLFLYPGHVHAITGLAVPRMLAATHQVSGVCAGFTARELVTALAVAVRNFEKGEYFFVNCYPRVVREEGQPEAMRLVQSMMEPCDDIWRGIGMIPASGMRLRPEFSDYDARILYQVPHIEGKTNSGCRCGSVLQGKIEPEQCPLFGKACTPEHPIGACMVSSEGACSAFYLYGRGTGGRTDMITDQEKNHE